MCTAWGSFSGEPQVGSPSEWSPLETDCGVATSQQATINNQFIRKIS